MNAAQTANQIRKNIRAQGEDPKGRVRVSQRHFGTFIFVDVSGIDEWEAMDGVTDRGADFEIEIEGVPSNGGTIGIDF